MDIEYTAVHSSVTPLKSGAISVVPKKEAKKFDINLGAENIIIPKHAVLEYSAIQAIDTNKDYIDENHDDFAQLYSSDARFSDAVIISKKEIDEGIESLQYLSEDSVKLRKNLALQMVIMGAKEINTDTKNQTLTTDEKSSSFAPNIRIDTTKIASTQKNIIAKMNIIKRASLSPSDAVLRDITIAMKANIIQAQTKLVHKKQILDNDDFETFVGRYDYTLSVLDNTEKIQNLVA